MDSKALMNRKTAIGAGLVAASPLLFPGRVRAQGAAAVADTFVVLLKGFYEPVVHGPNLGLSTVDLSDGTYSKTKIYPVRGTPGNNDPNKAIGDFYVQFTDGDLCAYHIPGGAFSMRFTAFDLKPVDDFTVGFSWKEPPISTSSRGPGFIDRSSAVTTSWSTSCTSPPPAGPTNTASASSAASNTSRRDRLGEQVQGSVRLAEGGNEVDAGGELA
jgi:hypothetical protein